MPVTRIEAYETSDGKIFHDEMDASEHEKKVPMIALRNQMADFLISFYRDDLKIYSEHPQLLSSLSSAPMKYSQELVGPTTVYMTVDKLLSSGALARFFITYKKILDDSKVR